MCSSFWKFFGSVLELQLGRFPVRAVDVSKPRGAINCTNQFAYVGMDDDDVLTEVIRQLSLSGPSSLRDISAVNKQAHALTQLDTIWRPMCLERWSPFLQASKWLEAAQQAETASDTPVWKEHYMTRERELGSGAGVSCAVSPGGTC